LHQAEEVVQTQLKTNPTPLMWCILGDLTGDESAYEKAWELSKHHFARAQRALGNAAAKRSDVRMVFIEL
jgi:hypothetical protein